VNRALAGRGRQKILVGIVFHVASAVALPVLSSLLAACVMLAIGAFLTDRVAVLTFFLIPGLVVSR